jgi:outer membrane protein
MLNSGWRRGSVLRSARVALVATTALTGAALHGAAADTLEGALALAYQNNPQLNAQRAATRATDETVDIALSGYRPKITATAQAGEQYLDVLGKVGGGYARSVGTFAVPAYGITGT